MNKNNLIIPILIFTLILSSSSSVFSQTEADSIPKQMKKVDEQVLEEDDEFSDMERELEALDEASKQSDTTKIRIGKTKIEVIEDDDDITINRNNDWEDDDDDWNDWGWDDDSWTFHKKKKKNKFQPHWASFYIGLNNYVTPDGSTTLDEEWQLLEVNTNNSLEVGLNVGQLGINLIKQRVGLVTGIGMKWNNYKFRNANTVLQTESGTLAVIESDEFKGKMSKLTTWYLMVPLLIEFQAPVGGDELYLNAGVEGGLKLNAHTKIKTSEKQKFKDKGDHFTTSLDYRLTARAGYGDFGIYAAYSMMPLFEKDKGPELYPVSVGVSVNF